MQFADMRALLRLPRDDVAPNVGCNLTMAATVLNHISGFSIWFFHTPYAQQLSNEEARGRGMPFSRRRFLGFVRAYYPRAIGEPQPATIATGSTRRATYSHTSSGSVNLAETGVDTKCSS